MLFKFPNNYGASVVRHNKSAGGKAGLFEVLPVQFKNGTSEPTLMSNVKLADNSVGNLFWEEVVDLLKDIKSLSCHSNS